MATIATFPITNVQVSGNQMSYTSAMDMNGLILWNVNANHGMGPPVIRVNIGSGVSVLPISIGGGQLCELRNSTNMTPVSGRFMTNGDAPVPSPQPTPSSPSSAPSIPMYPYLPPFSLPTPTFPAITIGDDNRGCNEIEVDGRTVTIEASEYGKMFFFCNKKEGGRVVLPKMVSPGYYVNIYNWASAEGYQQDTAKPILICGQEVDGKVYDMFPLQPGQKLTFTVIRGTSGRLRWAPF
jgi:hypothetical protein